MEHLCKTCFNLRQSLHVLRRGHVRVALNNAVKRTLPTVQYPTRHYATNDRSSEKKYKHGKLIVEKYEDPTYYPHYMMTFTGTDATVLDGYIHEVKKAAKMVDVDLTKSFNMPATEQTYKAKREGKGMVTEVAYTLKNYQRVVEIQSLTGEKSDIFMDYIQQAMPAGIQVEIQLKRWEKLVDPNHIMFRDENN